MIKILIVVAVLMIASLEAREIIDGNKAAETVRVYTRVYGHAQFNILRLISHTFQEQNSSAFQF